MTPLHLFNCFLHCTTGELWKQSITRSIERLKENTMHSILGDIQEGFFVETNYITRVPVHNTNL